MTIVRFLRKSLSLSLLANQKRFISTLVFGFINSTYFIFNIDVASYFAL